MSDKNKISKAEYQLYKYVDDGAVQLRWLSSDLLSEAVNDEAHGLTIDELLVLLYKLFDDRLLVAEQKSRGYFTPNYQEIRQALEEPSPSDQNWDPNKVTFYLYTSSALERYNELKAIYENS